MGGGGSRPEPLMDKINRKRSDVSLGIVFSTLSTTPSARETESTVTLFTKLFRTNCCSFHGEVIIFMQ